VLDGDGWSAACPRYFNPGKDLIPILEEAGWAPGLVWTGVENNLASHQDLIPGPFSL